MKALDFIAYISDSMQWGEVDTIEGTVGSNVRKILRVTESVLAATQSDSNWPELRKEGNIVLQASTSYDDGGAIAYGSTAFSDTVNSPFTVDDVGKVLQVSACGESR